MAIQKPTKPKKNPAVIVQLRVETKSGVIKPDPYYVWAELKKALENHPVLNMEQAEIRLEKHTSIDDE